jgi:16S rRNA C1402 (ribose-2'-O) methylase RsmI
MALSTPIGNISLSNFRTFWISETFQVMIREATRDDNTTRAAYGSGSIDVSRRAYLSTRTAREIIAALRIPLLTPLSLIRVIGSVIESSYNRIYIRSLEIRMVL